MTNTTPTPAPLPADERDAKLADLREELGKYTDAIQAHYTGRKRLTDDELEGAEYNQYDVMRTLIASLEATLSQAEAERDALREALAECHVNMQHDRLCWLDLDKRTDIPNVVHVMAELRAKAIAQNFRSVEKVIAAPQQPPASERGSHGNGAGGKGRGRGK